MLRYLAFGLGAAFAFASPAKAQSDFYLGGHVGLNYAADSDLVDDALLSGTDRAALDYADGTAFGGAIGFALDDIRTELEVTYRENDIDSVTFFSPTGTLPASGTVDSLAIIGNVYGDLDLGGPVTPYAGAGVGFTLLSFDDVTDSNGLLFAGDEVALIGQLILGAGIELTSNLTATLDYRYVSASPVRLNFNPAYPDGTIAGRRFDIDYQTHALMLGMRIGF
ncbi:MAG: outer membrane beta-barrel protein [Inquilinus sp.]|nr:outer membrane beta-barrel protein [Inquilinus sp.]